MSPDFSIVKNHCPSLVRLPEKGSFEAEVLVASIEQTERVLKGLRAGNCCAYSEQFNRDAANNIEIIVLGWRKENHMRFIPVFSLV